MTWTEIDLPTYTVTVRIAVRDPAALAKAALAKAAEKGTDDYQAIRAEDDCDPIRTDLEMVLDIESLLPRRACPVFDWKLEESAPITETWIA